MSARTSPVERADTAAACRWADQPLLLCRAGGALLGIEVGRVQHVGTVGPIRRVPLLPPHIKGVTQTQLGLAPLIDLRLRLGLPASECHHRTCVVEVDQPYPAALAVDTVDRVITLEPERIQPMASLYGRAVRSAVGGVALIEDEPCWLLDLDWILNGATPALAGSSTKRRSSRPQAEVAESPQERKRSRLPETQVDAPAFDRPDGPANRETIPARRRDEPYDAASSTLGAGRVLRLRNERDANASRIEHLYRLLAKPAFVGTRRSPGFRHGDPRLTAMATALLQMPSAFRSRQAVGVVAEELEHLTAATAVPPNAYRLAQFRYDLNKLRARHLAVRIGNTLQYRLTRIGTLVCESLAKPRMAVVAPGFQAA